MKYQASQVHMYAANSRVLADVTDLGTQPPSYEREPPPPAATARTQTSTHATHARQLRLDSPRREDNLCHIDHPARQLHARQIHSPGPLTTVHFWRNAYYYYEEVSVGVEANEGAIDVVRGFLVRSSGRTDSLNSSPPEHDAAWGRGLSVAARQDDLPGDRRAQEDRLSLVERQPMGSLTEFPLSKGLAVSFNRAWKDDCSEDDNVYSEKCCGDAGAEDTSSRPEAVYQSDETPLQEEKERQTSSSGRTVNELESSPPESAAGESVPPITGVVLPVAVHEPPDETLEADKPRDARGLQRASYAGRQGRGNGGRGGGLRSVRSGRGHARQSPRGVHSCPGARQTGGARVVTVRQHPDAAVTANRGLQVQPQMVRQEVSKLQLLQWRLPKFLTLHLNSSTSLLTPLMRLSQTIRDWTVLGP